MIPLKATLVKMLEAIIWDGLHKQLQPGLNGPRELTVIANDDTILIKMDGKKFFLNVYEENAPGAPKLPDPEKLKKKKK